MSYFIEDLNTKGLQRHWLLCDTLVHLQLTLGLQQLVNIINYADRFLPTKIDVFDVVVIVTCKTSAGR